MSIDLTLKPSCSGCGSTAELYGSNCKHMTLCVTCGKSMAERQDRCRDCGATVTRLIREYNVRAYSSSDKNYFIGRFISGLPNFSKNKNAENKWSIRKEGLQGRQLTDALRERFKNKPWLLEDESGQFQFHGVLEGAQSATYYLLMLQGKEFVAIPAGSWYNFNKVAQYKQLTLEEAEEKMKNRRKTADGYERWMMKAANNGAAAFGEVERFDDKGTAGGGRGRKKNTGDKDEANDSDKEDEDEEEESSRKSRLGLNKRGGDDDEEGPRGGDLDGDDDDIEKGDDWEHEEIFTDDDEAVWTNAEEREDLAAEIPAPPEIKQDEEDEEEADGEEGGLSTSGKELKKLLGRTGGLNESDADDDDDDEDVEDESSPVLAPKKEAVKEEPAENNPLKPASSGPVRGTTSISTKSAKGKRKINGDDTKVSNGAPAKKMKTENEVKPAKDEPVSSSKGNVPAKGASSLSPSNVVAIPSTGLVTEDEIRAVFTQKTPVTTQDLVAKFRSRLKCKELGGDPMQKRVFVQMSYSPSRLDSTRRFGLELVSTRELLEPRYKPSISFHSQTLLGLSTTPLRQKKWRARLVVELTPLGSCTGLLPDMPLESIEHIFRNQAIVEFFSPYQNVKGKANCAQTWCYRLLDPQEE